MKISLSEFLMQHTIMLHVCQVIDLMPLIGHHFRLQMDRTPDISKSVGVIYCKGTTVPFYTSVKQKVFKTMIWQQ